MLYSKLYLIESSNGNTFYVAATDLITALKNVEDVSGEFVSGKLIAEVPKYNTNGTLATGPAMVIADNKKTV